MLRQLSSNKLASVLSTINNAGPGGEMTLDQDYDERDSAGLKPRKQPSNLTAATSDANRQSHSQFNTAHTKKSANKQQRGSDSIR